ncbi:MAG TPA: DUF2752 domain-containing protein [Nocardioidaceae bacterium]|nr:DUF2752 domain-containing protein [Nocardioidaceae bacterium]
MSTAPLTAYLPSRLRRVRGPVLLAVAVLVASIALHLRDPHRSGSWGYCPWLLLTGTYCPGCGGLRAVNDLTNGDLSGAASSNLLFVGALPLVLFYWGRWVRDRWHGVTRRLTGRKVVLLAGGFGVAALAFEVARNLPVGAWLAP